MKNRLITLSAVFILAIACSQTVGTQSIKNVAAQARTHQKPTNTQASQPTQAPATASPTPGQTCVVTAQALNVRTCPALSCDVIGWLQAGQAVEVANVANSWAALTAGGWANLNYLQCEE